MSRTLVMGILNITPDSFADGGKYLSKEDEKSKGED
jgi:dihydropteroate synthase